MPESLSCSFVCALLLLNVQTVSISGVVTQAAALLALTSCKVLFYSKPGSCSKQFLWIDRRLFPVLLEIEHWLGCVLRKRQSPQCECWCQVQLWRVRNWFDVDLRVGVFESKDLQLLWGDAGSETRCCSHLWSLKGLIRNCLSFTCLEITSNVAFSITSPGMRWGSLTCHFLGLFCHCHFCLFWR